MKVSHVPQLIAAVLAGTLWFTSVSAQQSATATPDKVQTRLGTLSFRDGMPDAATTQKLYDELDYIGAT